MEIRKWRGLRNVETTERFRAGDLSLATDVDITDSGKVMSRQGQTVIDATAAHSLYSGQGMVLLMEGSTLKAVSASFTRTTIKQLSTSAPVSYQAFGETVFYSNGVDTGRLTGYVYGQWGVVPPMLPYATATSGSLPAGRYHYNTTFRRMDGQESGAGPSGAIDLPSGGGIAFSGFEVSTNPEVYDKILYVGTPNGDTVYRAASVLNAQTTAQVLELPRGVELDTQHRQQPPAGTMIRVHSGMMVVVQGGVAYFSDPFKPELFWLGENFLQFPGNIAVLESTGTGMYIATVDSGAAGETGGTWHVTGRALGQMTATQIFDYGAIPGTGIRTLAGYFEPSTDQGDEPHGGTDAAVWSTRHGVVVGFDGGQVKNLTENRYSLPSAQAGAAMIRLDRGFAQYVVALRGAGSLNNAAD